MVGPLQLPEDQRAALEAAYAVPVRAYHSLAHVREVLGHYADVQVGPGWREPAEAWLAVLYHDAIHWPGRRDNEVRSAQLAREHIRRWLPGSAVRCGRVAELIELTARHGSLDASALGAGESACDSMHFLDCDMAILGASPDQFQAYDLAIVSEYASVMPVALFRFNRRRFLQSLLRRERIFLSEFFHERYDASARENLRGALQRL